MMLLFELLHTPNSVPSLLLGTMPSRFLLTRALARFLLLQLGTRVEGAFKMCRRTLMIREASHAGFQVSAPPHLSSHFNLPMVLPWAHGAPVPGPLPPPSLPVDHAAVCILYISRTRTDTFPHLSCRDCVWQRRKDHGGEHVRVPDTGLLLVRLIEF